MKWQNNQKKLIASLIFNIVIFFTMITGIAIYITIERYGWIVLKFFTYQSNIVMGIISLVYSIYLILILKGKLKQIPKQLEIVKLMTTAGVVLTFVTVICILGPSSGWNKELYSNSSFVYHFVEPILALVTFILFEHSDNGIKYKETWYGIIHIGAYCIFYTVMGLTHIKDGKVPWEYDWYGFINTFTLKWCWVAIILMVGMGYLMVWLLWLANKKINLFPAKEVKKNQKKMKA